MSKWKRFCLGRNVFGIRAGAYMTWLSAGVVGLSFIYREVTTKRTSHLYLHLDTEIGYAILIACGIGSAIAGVRFAKRRTQAFAGAMLLIWHFVLLAYTCWLLSVLGRFRDIVTYWRL